MSVRLVSWCAMVVAAAILAAGGCDRGEDKKGSAAGQSEGGVAMSISITSSAFGSNQEIPRKYTGEGQDLSPPLAWSKLPAGTAELALICDDPDAPQAEPWVHWVIYKLPPTRSGLGEGVPRQMMLQSPAGAMQGTSSFGAIGYGGPMPPKGHGTHHYHFKLYALDAPLQVSGGLDKKALLAAMQGHILGQGNLVGTYKR